MSAATTVNVASAAIPENKTKKVSPSLIAVYVVLVVLAVVWLLPVIYTVTTSFKSVAEFTSNAFNFLPAKWVLDNYMTLIEASASYPVLNWLGNSLIISTVFAVLSVCIVALAGFGYSRLNFKYRDTLFFVLLLISMFPAVVNMIPQYRIIASSAGSTPTGPASSTARATWRTSSGAQLHEGHPEGTGRGGRNRRRH